MPTQYKIVAFPQDVDDREFEAELNALAAEGWKVESTFSTGGNLNRTRFLLSHRKTKPDHIATYLADASPRG